MNVVLVVGSRRTSAVPPCSSFASAPVGVVRVIPPGPVTFTSGGAPLPWNRSTVYWAPPVRCSVCAAAACASGAEPVGTPPWSMNGPTEQPPVG